MSHKNYKNIIILLTGLICLVQISLGDYDPNTIFDMSIEDLMDITVFSGSRHEQKITETSVPITIITAEDIHFSGLTSIPEILQFALGVDVLRLNQNYYAAGVRGLHDLTANRTMTLINGRSADSTIFGGAEFYRMPILVEDIERIEIIRGPGGAAWGANAFTGVINIITKKPEDLPDTWFASSTISEFGDIYSHLRSSFNAGPWDWRMSVGYDNQDGSENASIGNYSAPSGPGGPAQAVNASDNFKASSFSRNFILDTEGLNQLDNTNSLRVGLAYSHLEEGDSIYINNPRDTGWYETARSFSKFEHIDENDNTVYLQWSGNFSSSEAPNLKWKTAENNVETQYNFNNIENHQLAVGANIHHCYIEPTSNEPQIEYPKDHYNDFFAGLFLIDQIKMSERWSIETQFRTDWYSETALDWSARLSSLHLLDPQKKRNLRFSIAKAFRTPFTMLREAFSPTLGGPDDFTLLPPQENLENEQTWAVEAGYSEQLTPNTAIQINTYYQHLNKMIGYKNTSGDSNYQVANMGNAETYGAEIELKSTYDFGTISAWYAYNELRAKHESQESMEDFGPARHKTGLTCRVNLNEHWTSNLNYSYRDVVSGFATPTKGRMSHRLDLTLARPIANGNGEFMIGVLDILNRTHIVHLSSTSTTTYETPGRTFFTRLQWKF